MSVSTITNFQTAVAALAPASKNTYSLTYNPKNFNGTYNCQVQKNGVNFLTNFVYSGSQSSEATTDYNTTGATVSFVSPDGVGETADAQNWLNSLS